MLTVISGPLNSAIDLNSRKLLKSVGLLNDKIRNIDALDVGKRLIDEKLCTLICTERSLDLDELCSMSYVLTLSAYGVDLKDIVKVYISEDDYKICYNSIYAYYPIADVEICDSITLDFKLKSGEALILDDYFGNQFKNYKKLDTMVSSLERVTRKVHLYRDKEGIAYKHRP